MATINPATSGAPTGNIYVDALIWGGSWAPALGQGANLSWTTSLSETQGGQTVTARAWTPTELTALRTALQSWSNVSGLTFTEQPQGTAGTDLVEMLPDAAGRAVVEFEDEDQGQHATPSTGATRPLYGFYNEAHPTFGNDSLAQGGAAFAMILHEIGHGLGFAHPHDGGGDGQKFPGVVNKDSLGTFNLNQGVFTVMSYNDGWKSQFGTVGDTFGNAATPMALDIAAAQAVYGANTNFHNAGDSYALPTANAAGTFFSCIWDTGGTDTLSAAGATGAVNLDLRAAPLTGPNAGGYISSVAGIQGGFTIANGVVIENATGGSGNDMITGNAAANRLDGGAGFDTVSYAASGTGVTINLSTGLGSGGDAAGDSLVSIEQVFASSFGDSLLGSDSADTFFAGSGNDTSFGGNGADLLIGEGGNDVLAGEGGNDVLAGGDGLDILFGGDGNDWIEGGAGNDALLGMLGNDRLDGGAGNDWLIGGAGYDLLIGGAGVDVFQFNRADFVSGFWATIADFGTTAEEYEGIVLSGFNGQASFYQDGGNALIYDSALGLTCGVIVLNTTVAQLNGHLALI